MKENSNARRREKARSSKEQPSEPGEKEERKDGDETSVEGAAISDLEVTEGLDEGNSEGERRGWEGRENGIRKGEGKGGGRKG